MTTHPVETTDGKPDLVLLYGVQFIGSRVSIDVASSGGTDASYFSVKLEPAADCFELSIIQLKPDRLRMRRHIIAVTLDIPSVANPDEARFRLLNKFAPPGALPRFDR